MIGKQMRGHQSAMVQPQRYNFSLLLSDAHASQMTKTAAALFFLVDPRDPDPAWNLLAETKEPPMGIDSGLLSTTLSFLSNSRV